MCSSREASVNVGTDSCYDVHTPITALTQSSISTVDLYRVLVESVGDYAIFALDPTGHIVSWNLGAQRFKGYAPSEIIGRHFSVFYPPEEIGRAPSELQSQSNLVC